MNINFFDDPSQKPALREDVKIRHIQAEVSPEGRRVAVDFELTPFIERPSVDILVINGRGEKAGSLTIIETLDYRFGIVVHLRDKEPTDAYELHARLYYASLEEGQRQVVDTKTIPFSLSQDRYTPPQNS